MTENEQAAQGFLALLDFTHAVTGLGGGAIMLVILGLVARGVLSKVQEGMVSKDDMSDLEIDLKKELEDLQSYVMRIDKKEQKTRNAVMKIAGHTDIDLPELAD